MNTLKIGILILAFVFLVFTTIVDLPKTVNNIIYGIMGICSLFFIILKRKELQINNMFKKKTKDKSN